MCRFVSMAFFFFFGRKHNHRLLHNADIYADWQCCQYSCRSGRKEIRKCRHNRIFLCYNLFSYVLFFRYLRRERRLCLPVGYFTAAFGDGGNGFYNRLERKYILSDIPLRCNSDACTRYAVLQVQRPVLPPLSEFFFVTFIWDWHSPYLCKEASTMNVSILWSLRV